MGVVGLLGDPAHELSHMGGGGSHENAHVIVGVEGSHRRVQQRQLLRETPTQLIARLQRKHTRGELVELFLHGSRVIKREGIKL